MYANAYALVANQIQSAALGFAYWIEAARLYPVEVVGKSSAVISLLFLLAGLAQFGLSAGMTRFIPRAGRHTRKLILSAYLATPIAAALMGTVALLFARPLGIDSRLVPGGLNPALIVPAAMLWSVFYLQDGVLNGLRRSVWVLIENLTYNIAKLVLLVVGVVLLKDAGILGSWFLPTPFLILLVTFLVFFRFVRVDHAASATDDPLTLREMLTSVTGAHAGSVAADVSVRILPLLIVGLLGAAANAYFYQAWLVANALTLVAYSMTSSFTAQAASDRANIGSYSRGILRQMAVLLVPAAAIVGVAAPLVLSLFGKQYALSGTLLLRVLAVAALPAFFNTWYINYSLLLGRVRRVVGLQLLGGVLLVGVSYVGLPAVGIVAVGIAWLVGQGAIAAFGAFEARHVLWPERAMVRADR
jgi:O-antigen/teichoic acid export membrane protein